MNKLFELEQENQTLKEMVKMMSQEIFIEYQPHFSTPEKVEEFFRNQTETTFCTTCTEKEQETCRVEKLKCNGCYYYERKK